jgi:hypothetical protein
MQAMDHHFLSKQSQYKLDVHVQNVPLVTVWSTLANLLPVVPFIAPGVLPGTRISNRHRSGSLSPRAGDPANAAHANMNVDGE